MKKYTIQQLSRKIKSELRKRGYRYEKHNLKSPYSNSQYFRYYNKNTRSEIRVSDHDYPNHNHTFRGWDFDINYWDDNWEDFIEDLDWYSEDNDEYEKAVFVKELLKQKEKTMNKKKIAKELLKLAKEVISYDKDWSYGDRSAPSTPWGKAQTAQNIERGVVFYTTAGHGGLAVANGVARRKLTPQARAIGEKRGQYYWFEEDVAVDIPMYENEDWMKKLAPRVTKKELEKTIERYYPEYFDENSINEKKKEEENENSKPKMKDLKVGDELIFSGLNINKVLVEETGSREIRGQDSKSGQFYRIPSRYYKYVVEIKRNNKTLWER